MIVDGQNGILEMSGVEISKSEIIGCARRRGGNMRNILLTIEYDGTNFCGWQRQPDRRSVQGEVERALSVVCGKPVQINGTSRTDAGVHAYGQRANFRGEFGIPTDRIPVAVNNILGGGMNAIDSVGDIRLISVEEVPPEFHARFEAKGKKYVYKIRNCEQTDLFRKNYCYQVRKPLDVDAMREAAEFIVGTHDFRCFQSAGGEERKTTVRTIYDLSIGMREKVVATGAADAAAGELLSGVPCREIDIEIIGDGFLYNMVRIIAGTLADVGVGKKHPLAVPSIIESRDRQNAGHTAPPQGLYLAEVYFQPPNVLRSLE